MGKRSRTKGHDFEREVAQAFRPVYPEARRQLEYNEADCNGVDLAHTGPYRVQCKRMKKYVNPSVIEEVKLRDAKAEIPVLVTRADKKPALAVIPLDALIGLITIAERQRTEAL
jgi:hypothetical protein